MPLAPGARSNSKATQGEAIRFGRMLDELAETGYTGTELGDWGYMPNDPAALSRGARPARPRHARRIRAGDAEGPCRARRRLVDAALKTARLLAAVATDPKPYLVLADNNGSVPERTLNAGTGHRGTWACTAPNGRVFAEGANRIARAVMAETGLRTVFHHHCAGYVETPDEIERFLDLTDPRGHRAGLRHRPFRLRSGLVRRARGPSTGLRSRIWYVHFKDCSPAVAAQARASQWDYFQALRHGVFCELGRGGVDFPAVLRWLADTAYSGYVLVEQDVLPGMGAPRESARRNREYLRSIEEGDAGTTK